MNEANQKGAATSQTKAVITMCKAVLQVLDEPNLSDETKLAAIRELTGKVLIAAQREYQ